MRHGRHQRGFRESERGRNPALPAVSAGTDERGACTDLVVSVDTPVPQAYTMYYQRGEQARFVDYMIVMAYDEHFAGCEEAGSVSSLPFGTAGRGGDDAGDACRSGDLRNPVLYPCLDGKVRTERHYQRGAGHGWRQKLCQRESDDRNLGCIPGQNVATVETSDARYTIWMEDEQSMEEKLKVIQSADLAGVAEWKLGFECA